jgi:ATP-dependent RNA helicase RhlE
MRFEQYSISDQIKKNLLELGFKKPTDIQYKAISPILKGEDVLAIAQTGTGKTAAFTIPVLHKLIKDKHKEKYIRCIVMVPTRELALQISEVFHQIGKNTGIKTFCVYGGIEQDEQINQLKSGIDVLVATPGRTFDLINQGYIKLDRLEILIIDEADQMLDKGFIKDIKDLLKFIPKKRQTLFFSATIDSDIKKLAYSLVNNPIRIQISPENPVSKNVEHSVVFVDKDDKRFFLERVITDNPEKKILVFVRTKIRAERVCNAMARIGIEAKTLHGDKNQKERQYVLKQFKNGEIKVLIATDVSSRGIDIPEVEYVVNYDLPEFPENYVHRVGRTGRGNKKGIAFSFCSMEEKNLLINIENYIGKKISVIKLDKEIYSEIIDFSEQAESDWKTLIKNYEQEIMKKKKNKK